MGRETERQTGKKIQNHKGPGRTDPKQIMGPLGEHRALLDQSGSVRGSDHREWVQSRGLGLQDLRHITYPLPFRALGARLSTRSLYGREKRSRASC